MAALTEQQIRNYAQQAGFSGQALDYIVAIAKRESGWDPTAYNGTGPDNSVGLTQINMIGNLADARIGYLQQMGYNVQTKDQAVQLLKDPEVNMKMAYLLSSNGTNFSPWKMTSDPNSFLDFTYLASTGGTASHFAGAKGTAVSVGGSGDTGQQISSDPDLQNILAGLQSMVKGRMQAYQQDPSDDNLAQLEEALANLEDFTQGTGLGGSNDPAQTAFDNSIKAGDLSIQQASEKYQEWADKADRARAAAEGEITNIQNENNALPDMVKAQFQTQGRVNPGQYTSFGNPNYQDVLAKWNQKMGVGDAPAFPDVGDPYAASAAASSNGAADTTYQPSTLNNDSLPDPAAIQAVQGGSPQSASSGADGPGKFLAGAASGAITGGAAAGPVGALAGGLIGGAVAGTNYLTGGQEDFPFEKAGKDTAKKVKHWWDDVTSGLPGFARGTASAPGGPAMVGEKGTEQVVLPDGRVVPVGMYGPEVQDIPQGSAVLPAGVPPNEAFAYAQIRKALAQQPQGANPLQMQADAQQRAQDPQLQAKVRAALLKAMANQVAMHPPATPQLEDPTRQRDLWAPFRVLTGVPASGPMPQPAAAGGKR